MERIHLRYFKSNNFGDALNLLLVKFITGKKPVVRLLAKSETENESLKKIESYFVIGSILQSVNQNTIVWGAGFISKEDKIKQKPKMVLAVRGPLSRKKLIEQDVKCPEVYGDPALLLPRFYKPKIKKKYKLGIVPHYVDKNSKFLEKFKKEGVLIIDIEDKIKNVVKNILRCEKIVSSSLHGIIVADAYKIPSVWAKFSEGVIGKGFKFRDYFASVGRKDKKPLVMTGKTTIKDIENQFYDYEIKIDLKKLWRACPFKRE